MDRQSLLVAGLGCLVLEVAMVVTGHHVPWIKDNGFAIGGMAISLLAGVAYAVLARGSSWGSVTAGGAIVGGAGAFLAIVLSLALKDVPPIILVIGTVSSIVTGMIGAALGKLIH